MKGAKQVNPKTLVVKSFAWSFKPMFLLMNVMAGLKLQPSINSFSVNVAICAWGIILILSNILVNGYCQLAYNLYYIIEHLLDFVDGFEKNTKMESRLFITEGFNFYYRCLFLFLGIPLIFLVQLIMPGKWAKLWSILQTIQVEMRLSALFYRKCRKRCYFGLGLFVLLLAPIFYDYACHWIRDNWDDNRPPNVSRYVATGDRDIWYWREWRNQGDETLYHVAYALHNWCRAIELAIQSVFFIFVMTASLLFEELGERVSHSSKTSTGLDRWKRHYHLVCCFLEEINSIFGLILLIQIGYIIIEMIKDSFHFMWAFKMGKIDFYRGLWVFVINYVHVLVRLLITVISSWHMQNQQTALIGAVLILPSHPHPQQQLEMNTVLLHLSSFLIPISAADVLNVDTLLFVPVFSASLNYGSVLFQDSLTYAIKLSEGFESIFEASQYFENLYDY